MDNRGAGESRDVKTSSQKLSNRSDLQLLQETSDQMSESESLDSRNMPADSVGGVETSRMK